MAGQAEGGPVEGGVEGLQFCFCIFIICIAVKGEVGGRQAELYFSFFFWDSFVFWRQRQKFIFFSAAFMLHFACLGVQGVLGVAVNIVLHTFKRSRGQRERAGERQPAGRESKYAKAKFIVGRTQSNWAARGGRVRGEKRQSTRTWIVCGNSFPFCFSMAEGSVCGGGGKLFVAQIYVYDAAVFAWFAVIVLTARPERAGGTAAIQQP